jgi:hypothetical protein
MAAGYHLKQYEELKALIAKLEQRVKALENRQESDARNVGGIDAARKVLSGQS